MLKRREKERDRKREEKKQSACYSGRNMQERRGNGDTGSAKLYTGEGPVLEHHMT